MRHITYLIILNLLFLNVYNAESQITKKPVFSKSTYEPLKVTQTTKVCDPESITLTASATNYCKLSKILNFAYQIDYNNDGTFESSGTGNQAILGNHTAYKFGTHKIKWLVADGCGGISTCSKLVTIVKAKDNIKPTPIAKLLLIELMPNNCTAVLEATTVNNFSYDDCTAAKDLRFKIAKSGEYNANMSLADVLALKDYVSFVKEIGTQTIALFVIDEDNNWNYIETFVVVQSNMNPDCGMPNPIEITGTIKTSKNEVFYDSNTIIKASFFGFNDTIISLNIDGSFNFSHNLKYPFSAILKSSLTVTSSTKIKSEILKINKDLLKDHILGNVTISNPYALIAADVNGDGKINYADIVALDNILDSSKPDSFTNYRFINADTTFTTYVSEIELYPKTIYFLNLFLKNYDFKIIAIIPGDIYNNLFYQPIDRSAIDNKTEQLFQNQPNPFSEKTKIIFELAKPENVQLEILDFNGKKIFSKMLNAQFGYNELEIDSNELNGAGIYLYQLKTSNSILSKKMILTN